MKIVYLIPTKKEMFAKVSIIISKGFNERLHEKKMIITKCQPFQKDVRNKWTYNGTSFTILFKLKVVIFFVHCD